LQSQIQKYAVSLAVEPQVPQSSLNTGFAPRPTEGTKLIAATMKKARSQVFPELAGAPRRSTHAVSEPWTASTKAILAVRCSAIHSSMPGTEERWFLTTRTLTGMREPQPRVIGQIEGKGRAQALQALAAARFSRGPL
jgi:hypothetical protein